MSYDTWLEKPYTDRAALELRVEQAAEKLFAGSVEDLYQLLSVKDMTALEQIVDRAAEREVFD